MSDIEIYSFITLAAIILIALIAYFSKKLIWWYYELQIDKDERKRQTELLEEILEQLKK